MNEFMDQGVLAWLALSEFMCPVLRSAAMVRGVLRLMLMDVGALGWKGVTGPPGGPPSLSPAGPEGRPYTVPVTTVHASRELYP